MSDGNEYAHGENTEQVRVARGEKGLADPANLGGSQAQN